MHACVCVCAHMTLPVPVAHEDRSSLWTALTGIIRRRYPKRRRFSSVEDGVYLEDLGRDMDPEELSRFFPARWVHCSYSHCSIPL